MDPGAERRLERVLTAHRRLAVAVSGGVDSAVLWHAAHAALGERAVALIADSPSLPRADLAEARALADDFGAPLVEVATTELDVQGYVENAGDRCYWCRHTLFTAMEAWAAEHGFTALAYGEITDDLADVRPGRRAAGEFGVVAPLREAGWSKEDVRRYAAAHDVRVADKPASACLASRLPVGTRVTRERLLRVEVTEADVRALGLRVLRVRDHGEHARLEVGEDELEFAKRMRDELERILRAHGFATVELAAYRSPVSASAGRSGAAPTAAPAPGS